MYTIRITDPDVDPRLRRVRHGDWGVDRYGGHHDCDIDCYMNGRHLLSNCRVKHRFLDGPCPVVRMWCPESGAEIHVRVKGITEGTVAS